MIFFFYNLIFQCGVLDEHMALRGEFGKPSMFMSKFQLFLFLLFFFVFDVWGWKGENSKAVVGTSSRLLKAQVPTHLATQRWRNDNQ